MSGNSASGSCDDTGDKTEDRRDTITPAEGQGATINRARDVHGGAIVHHGYYSVTATSTLTTCAARKVVTAAWQPIHPYWEHAGMIVYLLCQVARKLLSAASVLLRDEAAKDAELLVLRHENTVLRRQLVGPIRYEPADRFWFAALSGLIYRSRWRQAFCRHDRGCDLPAVLPAYAGVVRTYR